MAEVRARILQISDLHFGKKIDRDLKTRLFHIVAEVVPDVLIVTGDLVDHPWPWRVKQAAKFLDELCGKCPSKRPRLAVVPGNHDYKFWGNFGLRRLTRVPFHVYFRQGGLSQPLRDRILKYLELFVDALRPWGKALRDGLQNWEFEDLGVIVLGFNSNPLVEMLAAGRVDAANLVELDQYCARRKDDPRFACQYRIAVLHHHPAPIAYVPTDLKARVQESFMVLYNAGTFLRKLNEHCFQLVLHGHRHFAGFLRLRHDIEAGETREVAVAAAGSALHPHPDDYRGNHLNLVELRDDGTAALHSWYFSAEAGKKEDSVSYELHDLQGVRRMRCQRLRAEKRLRVAEQRKEEKITADGYTWIREQALNCRAASDAGVRDFAFLLEAEAPSYLRGVELSWPPGAPPMQKLKTIPEGRALRRFEGSIDFGQLLRPADGQFSFGCNWRLINGHALTREEFLRRYADADPPVEWEWASVTCDTPCDLLTLAVQFPDNYDISTLNTDVEVRYLPEPLECLSDYKADQLRDHPEEATRIRGGLEHQGTTVTLRCSRPVPGFIYCIRWSFREGSQSPQPSLSAESRVRLGKRQLVEIARAAGRSREPYGRIRKILDVLAQDLMSKLSPPGRGSRRTDELDVSLMVFDELTKRLRFVCANFGEVTELVNETFVSGEGCAGFAFEKARYVLYHPARDTVGYYIRPEERRAEGQLSALPAQDCLVSLPWIHPSGIVVGVVNVGSQWADSVLLQLFDLRATEQQRAMETLQALTNLAANGILEMVVQEHGASLGSEGK